jgi:hypothetical protein
VSWARVRERSDGDRTLSVSADRQRLAGLGERREPRGQVDRVAEHVLAVVDDRPVVETRVDRERRAAARLHRRDLRLHRDRRVGGVGGVRNSAIASSPIVLTMRPAVLLADLPDHLERAADRGERFRVTKCLVQLGAAGDVGEQDRGLSLCVGLGHPRRRRGSARV